MTYPQGPYGQQPDPYGQQQPQYGGGYQQQPQYGGAYDPNTPQYGGAYGQQYGGFSGGPQPPKNNKGPVIAIVAIVVLILAGVGITGFVAPGFFLSDDKGDNSASGSGTSTSNGNSDSGADAFIKKLVSAADAKSKSKLEGYQCSDATDSVKNATKHIDEIDSAELKDTREKSKTEVVAELNIVVDGDGDDYEATVTKDGGDWCWSDFSGGKGGSSDTSANDDPVTPDESTPESGPGGGSGSSSDGVQFVQSFLDKLNGGDGAGAAGMSCSDSTSQQDITTAASQGAQLQIDQSGLTSDSTYVGAPLTGTVGGQSVTARTSAFVEDGNWCIYTFFAY